MDVFDIFIAYVNWGDDGKRRPVLILDNGLNNVVVFNITTRYEEKSEVLRQKYFKITEWKQAGLNYESYIDTNKTTTLPISSIEYPIGSLTEIDVQRLLKFLAKQK